MVGVVGTEAGNGEMLLDGENPATGDPVEVRSWITVYSGLVAIHERAASRGRRQDGQGEPAALPVPNPELDHVIDRLRRARRRLDYWQARLLEIAGLGLDAERQLLEHQGRSARLTRRELQLLSLLLSSPKRWFTAREIRRDAWHKAELCDEQVRIYVSRLRGKLQAVGAPCRLANRPHQGYSILWRGSEQEPGDQDLKSIA